MKVRIPFVVNPKGRWAASGYPGCEDVPDWGFLMDQADNGEDSSSDYQRGWVTVDLPEPQYLAEVDGDVSTHRRSILEEAAAICDGIAQRNLYAEGKVFTERVLTAQVIRDKIRELATRSPAVTAGHSSNEKNSETRNAHQ